MNLNEAIDQVRAIDGYRYHRLRAEDHMGMVQCYTFWFNVDGELKAHEVRFLVVNIDELDEEAWIYSTKHIQPKSTSFKDEVTQKIPQFQTANPEYEKIILLSVREIDETAELLAYKYNSETNTSERVELVVFKKADTLIVRTIV